MGDFGRWLGREFPRVLVSLGPAVAVVGVVVYAMATSFRETRDADVTISVVLMIVGIALLLAGVLAMRAGMGAPTEPPDEPIARRAPASPSPPAAQVSAGTPTAPTAPTAPTGRKSQGGGGSRNKRR